MDSIDTFIGNYVASRDDIPNVIKEKVKRKAIDAYMKRAQDNPEDFNDKLLVTIIAEIMKEIEKDYPDNTTSRANTTPGAAGGSRRRRRRRSTRTSKKGKKYSTTRRRK